MNQCVNTHAAPRARFDASAPTAARQDALGNREQPPQALGRSGRYRRAALRLPSVIKLRETWKLITQLMEPVEALSREAAIVKAIEGLDAEEQSGAPSSLGGRVRAD